MPLLLAQSSVPWPDWFAPALPWLALLGLAVGVGLLVGVFGLAARLRALERATHRLESLESIEQNLARLTGQRGDLDLRRVEHVLLELRDSGRRLEDALLSHQQSARALEAPEREPGARATLSERVVTRLLALGYTRVRVLTTLTELEALGAEADGGNGAIVVEARRDGALCKGRVYVRRGALTEVEVQPAYNTFP